MIYYVYTFDRSMYFHLPNSIKRQKEYLHVFTLSYQIFPYIIDTGSVGKIQLPHKYEIIPLNLQI